MADDEVIEALRGELERQRVEAEIRHQTLVEKLAEREAKPLTQADANRTMASGYAETAAERKARQGGAA